MIPSALKGLNIWLPEPLPTGDESFPMRALTTNDERKHEHAAFRPTFGLHLNARKHSQAAAYLYQVYIQFIF